MENEIMATKVEAGTEAVKRAEYFLVDPNGVQMDLHFNGRHKPITADAIQAMAEKFLKHGQLQPIQCRKLPGSNNLTVSFGFTRTLAARLIRQGFVDSEGTQRHDPEFRLKTTMVNCNDKEAFVNNVVENNTRNTTSDVDDAHNQRKLRDQYGFEEKEIMALYGYKNPTKLSRLKNLLALPDYVQDLIHSGQLATSAGLDLLGLNDYQMLQVIEIGRPDDDDGKFNATAMRKLIRELTLSGTTTETANEVAEVETTEGEVTGETEATDGETTEGEVTGETEATDGETTEGEVTGETEATDVGDVPFTDAVPAPVVPQKPATGFKARSRKEFKEFIEVLDGPAYGSVVRGLAAALLQWYDGKIIDKQLSAHFEGIDNLQEKQEKKVAKSQKATDAA